MVSSCKVPNLKFWLISGSMYPTIGYLGFWYWYVIVAQVSVKYIILEYLESLKGSGKRRRRSRV